MDCACCPDVLTWRQLEDNKVEMTFDLNKYGPFKAMLSAEERGHAKTMKKLVACNKRIEELQEENQEQRQTISEQHMDNVACSTALDLAQQELNDARNAHAMQMRSFRQRHLPLVKHDDEEQGHDYHVVPPSPRAKRRRVYEVIDLTSDTD